MSKKFDREEVIGYCTEDASTMMAALAKITENEVKQMILNRPPQARKSVSLSIISSMVAFGTMGYGVLLELSSEDIGKLQREIGEVLHKYAEKVDGYAELDSKTTKEATDSFYDMFMSKWKG